MPDLTECPACHYRLHHSQVSGPDHIEMMLADRFEELQDVGAMLVIDKLLRVIQDGHVGTFGDPDLERLAQWIAQHRILPAPGPPNLPEF